MYENCGLLNESLDIYIGVHIYISIIVIKIINVLLKLYNSGVYRMSFVISLFPVFELELQ